MTHYSNRTAFRYWALSLVTLIVMFFTCNKSYGQTNPKPSPDSTVIIQNFIDSIAQHTSIRAMQSWLYENVSGKTYAEGKFAELYNIYIQTRYNQWIAEKNKPQTTK